MVIASRGLVSWYDAIPAGYEDEEAGGDEE